MRIEDKYPDILQNIEFAAANLYRKNPKMVDYDVLGIYEKLAELYKAESLGREFKMKEMSGLEAELFRDTHRMCEWRLGQCDMPNELGLETKIVEPTDLATLILCLKRLIKSVEKWRKHYGIRGYLDVMTKYVK